MSMDHYTILYYFLLGFVPPAIFVIAIASFEANSLGRFCTLLVGITAMLFANYKVVSLAMPRTTATPDHIIVMSSIYYQPEVMAFGIGVVTLFAIWSCYIAYFNLFSNKTKPSS